jgi:hypothetical protein
MPIKYESGSIIKHSKERERERDKERKVTKRKKKSWARVIPAT